MKRGVITLTIDEVKEIEIKFGDGRLSGSPLESKLDSISNGNISESQIEVSEEELETILDEFAIPSTEDTPSIISLRSKLQRQLVDFRKNDQMTI